MNPGYNAFIGIKDAAFCCILFFNHMFEIKETEEQQLEREEQGKPLVRKWKLENEFLGINWHESAQDIDDSIQKIVPTAYIQYFTPEAIKLRPAFGTVSVRSFDCPMMRLVRDSVMAARTRKSIDEIYDDAIKIAAEIS